MKRNLAQTDPNLKTLVRTQNYRVLHMVIDADRMWTHGSIAEAKGTSSVLPTIVTTLCMQLNIGLLALYCNMYHCKCLSSNIEH